MRWINFFKELFIVEFKLFLREPLALFFTVAFPIILLLIFGSLVGGIEIEVDELPETTYRVIDFYIPALIGVTIGQLGILGMPITLSEYREQGVLKRFKVSAVPLWLHGAAIILVGVLFFLISAALTVLVGEGLYDITFGGSFFVVTSVIVVGCVAFFSLGFVLAGLLPSARACQAAGPALFLPMIFLSGAAGPREEFTPVLYVISEAMPLTWIVETLSTVWLGVPLSETIGYFAALIGLIVVAFPVARFTFRWS